MAGTNVNQMLMFMQESLQTQQNALVKGSSTAKNTEKPDFEEFMQTSTANTENVNSQKITETPTKVEQPKENITSSDTNTSEATEVTEVTEVTKETNVTTEVNRQEVTKTPNVAENETVEENVQKNTFFMMKNFKNKVEQTVAGELKSAGIVDLAGKLEGTLISLDVSTTQNMVEIPEMPNMVEVPKTMEDGAIKIPEGNVEVLVTEGIKEDLLQQKESMKEEEILDLGSFSIKIQFSENKEIAITMPDAVTMPDTVTMENQNGISDKLVVNMEIPKDLKEVLKTVQEQLVQKIVDNFQVTEEEVSEAMEVLAIQFFDLANSDKLKELAVYLSDEQTLVSLVTNEQLFTAYKEAEAGIAEVMDVLPKDLVSALEELSESVEELQTKFSENQLPKDVVIPESPEMNVPVDKKDTTMVQKENQKNNSKDNSKDFIPVEIVKTEDVPEEQPKQETAKSPQITAKTEEKLLSETQRLQQDLNGNSFQQEGSQKETKSLKTETPTTPQSSTTVTTVVTETEVQTVVKTQHTDFEGIVRQIVEQVKVQIKPDTVSMELQLNPENLGKVNLQVSSKEGAITAQLMVQNETVKAAIEGQLMVLRETMQQQGIKVDAVEVAVQTGDFGRSLEQQSQQGKEEARQRSKTQGHRGINLLAGVDEENMNEEELLRAHIMRESGNSVDMNA